MLIPTVQLACHSHPPGATITVQVAVEFSKGRTLALYAIPALLYAVLNNLTVLLLLYVTPVEVSTQAINC